LLCARLIEIIVLVLHLCETAKIIILFSLTTHFHNHHILLMMNVQSDHFNKYTHIGDKSNNVSN